MSGILPHVRFVRQLDLRTWDLRTALVVNPRTLYAETRAGLSWTGIRPYNTAEGVLRVLRRRSQVEAPAHLKTLRRMATPAGHPSGDRDVLPSNSGELFAGYTGDDITIETVDGFARPVADLTVIRPSVFAEMMGLDQWRDYAAAHPKQAVGVSRGIGPAKTGTSLGYNALWVSPTVEAEIVKDEEGALVGAWLGPDGRSYPYDVEHVVDADCELVQRLVRDENFDAAELGGQHFAINLEAMNGRGGKQSELIRVIDERTIGDPTRGRVLVQVPRATKTVDMKWTVGASEDLPLEEGDRAWDGDAAAASIFEGAGWPDAPDADAAKLGFLVYDADASELKGSYKLPFARRDEGGKLHVPKSALEAAASFLPRTDIPEDVKQRAREVLDGYVAKYERAQAQESRDATPKKTTTMTTTQNVKIEVRDQSVAAYLKTKGLGLASTSVVLDMAPAAQVEAAVEDLLARISALAEMLKASEDMGEEMKEKMGEQGEELAAVKATAADMPDPAALKKQVAELEGQLAATKEELAKASKASDDAKASHDAKVADLNELLGPFRAQQLTAHRDSYVKLGLSEDAAAKCEDEAALKRAFVVSRVGDQYAEKSDELVDASFDTYMKFATKAPAKDEADKGKAYTPGAGLTLVPVPQVVKAADKDDSKTKTQPQASTAGLLAAGLDS